MKKFLLLMIRKTEIIPTLFSLSKKVLNCCDFLALIIKILLSVYFLL